MIGIFDSGIGGFTVVREMMRRVPAYKLLYFGDSARAPYGNKGAETIKKYAAEDAEFLISRGAKLIIIACNTVSAVAYDYLCEKFPTIPIFEVITPAAEAAVRATKNGRIGVIGTRATINSGIYKRKIKELEIGNCPDGNRGPPRAEKLEIFDAACPLLVPLVEEGWIDRSETKMIARKYLWPLKQKHIDTLILGCTLYPLIKDVIRDKIGKKVKIVDSAEEVVAAVLKYLENNSNFKKTLLRLEENQFYLSDVTPAAENTIRKWLSKNVNLNPV
jgi:glutamate racemase